MAKTQTTTALALVLMSREEIKTEQDGIKVALNNLDATIHHNAVQCMLHAEKHGDTSLMTRLLMDIVDQKSGYRRSGLIQWMRSYSPMELVGKVINLSGVNPSTGERRPFRVDEADANPFRTDSKFNEVVKPLFSTVLMSKLNSAVKEFTEAKANTINGQAIDKSKPFLMVDNVEQFEKFFDMLTSEKAKLPEIDIARDRYKHEQEGLRIAREAATMNAPKDGGPKEEIAA